MINLRDDPVFQQIVAKHEQKTRQLVEFIKARHPDIQAGASTGGCWRAPNKDREHGLIFPDSFMTKHFPRHELKEGSIIAFGHIGGEDGRCYIGRVIEALDTCGRIDEVHKDIRDETVHYRFIYTYVAEVIETIGYDAKGDIRITLPENR